MKSVSENILELVTTARPRLMAIAPESACRKMSPDSWSKQEILGHLVDSALNNHQRFVRGALNAAKHFPTYDQNRWVDIQGYNERVWEELVGLWAQCNLHLYRILDRLPEEALNNLCNIGDNTQSPLRAVIEDYLSHLKLHLEQILETIE